MIILHKKFFQRLFFILFYPLLLMIQSLLYFVLFIRHLLYDSNILRTHRFNKVYVICVGNLNFGGSGKTPLTDFLINLLKHQYKIAVLSRGYGRKTKGFKLVNIHDDYNLCGDEPVMYKFKHPELIVAVCENRVNGIKQLLHLFPHLQIIILDDAFQHRPIKAHLNILVTEYSRPFFEDQLFPLGTLRDLKQRANRADILIISKTPKNADEAELQKKLHQAKQYFKKDIFFNSIEYTSLYSINSENIIQPYKELSHYNCILVTGIANPQPLSDFIKEYSNYFYHLKFPDHHAYTNDDFDLIKKIYIEWNSKYANTIIVTTEKDAMRLKTFAKKHFNLPIFIAPIQLYFLNHQEFEQKILNYVRANTTNHSIHT